MTRISQWLPASTLTVGLAASSIVFIAPTHAQPVDPDQTTQLLDETSEWNYLDDGNDPANGHTASTDWTAPDFDDASWASAQGSFGASNGEHTTLGSGHDADNLLDQHEQDGTNTAAFFFRSTFTIEADELENAEEITGSLLYDDAAIVYLNGERVEGFNDDQLVLSDEGEDRNMVYSGAEHAVSDPEQFTIDPELLTDGENTIAVQLHQANEDSADVYFELESLSLTTATDEPEDEPSERENDSEPAETEAEESNPAEDDPTEVPEQSSLQPFAMVDGQTWNYLDDGTDPANGLADRTDWTTPEFDDSDWDSAAGSFGALRGEQEELSGGYLPDNLLDQYYPDTTVNKEAFFFRTDITVAESDLESAEVLTGSVRYDDAVTIFVNGERVAGFHDGGLEFSETGDDRNMVYGGSNSSAPILERFTVPDEVLVAGENTIAVQLHQGRDTSSDIYFDMESLDFEAAPLGDRDTSWSYLDDGTDPSDGLEGRSDWTTPEFDDSSWPTSNGGSFGALRGEQESLSGGYYPDNLLDQYYDDSSTNKEAFFFRTEISIDAAELTDNTVLEGSIRYDDAAIVYINGERVAGFSDDDIDFAEEGERRNMVYGGANRTSPLQGEFSVGQELLQPGNNTIAVQLHQGRDTSSDIYFGLESLEFAELESTNDGPSSILLGMGADPSERRLSWVTDSQTPEIVQLAEGAYDTMPADAATIDATEQDEYARWWGREYVHATLSELSEGTYTYRVGSSAGGWSDLAQFQVHPQNLEHEFTFVGDAQLGSSGNLSNDAEGWQRALDANDQLFPESQFILSAGDQVENYLGDSAEYEAYIAPEQMRSIPSAATLGNHDYAFVAPQQLYGQHYNQPNMADYDDTRGSYWFIYNDVLHLNISTEYRNWDDHREFLETTIAEHGGNTHWTMLTFHRPLYSVANHSTSSTTDAIRDGLGPIINDLDIDMVLTGHDHSYSRSFLIDVDGNQVDPATSETVVDIEGNVVEPESSMDPAQESETPPLTYEGEESSPRLADSQRVRVTPELGDTLFVTANSSSGSKYYNMRDASEYRDGFQPRFRDQQSEQNITNVAVDQCTITTNTVELDGTAVDTVELLRDRTEPELTVASRNVEFEADFDPLANVSVTDDCATLTTDDVLVEGEVDTDEPGAYTLTYSVTDDAGNTTSVERVVTVAEPEEDDDPTPTPTPTPSPEPTTPGDDEDPDDTGEDEQTDGNGNGTDQDASGDNGNGDDRTGDDQTGTTTDEAAGTGGTDTVGSSGDKSPSGTERVAESKGFSGWLANTGANIWWIMAIGVIALAVGMALVMAKRRRQM